MKWQEVNGWLSEAEGTALRELARDKKVLEIGAYCGRSTCAMAETASLVVSVDTHRGLPAAYGADSGIPATSTGHGDTLLAFCKNFREFDRGNVIPIVGNVEQVLPMFRDGMFDLVFIDGDHAPDSVLRDIELSRRLVKPGGKMAWHDINEFGILWATETLGIKYEGTADRMGWITL